MKRTIGFGIVVLIITTMAFGPASAKDNSEATISALQTKVTELEDLLTPTTGSMGAVTGSGTSSKLFGPAIDLLPPGEPGLASVVLVGPYGTWLPIVIRNNTDYSLGRVDVSVAAYSSDGALIGAGSSLEIQPAIIDPGGYGIGNVSFSFLDLPADTSFKFKVEGEADSEPYLLYDLTIANATFQVDRIVGEISNDTGLLITNNAQVMFACLNPSGALTNVDSIYSADTTIQPGGTAIFQIDEYYKPCELFLLTAKGFSNP